MVVLVKVQQNGEEYKCTWPEWKLNQMTDLYSIQRKLDVSCLKRVITVSRAFRTTSRSDVGSNRVELSMYFGLFVAFMPKNISGTRPKSWFWCSFIWHQVIAGAESVRCDIRGGANVQSNPALPAH